MAKVGYGNLSGRGKQELKDTALRMERRLTAFRAGCRPIAKGSKFYDLDELERCFGRG